MTFKAFKATRMVGEFDRLKRTALGAPPQKPPYAVKPPAQGPPVRTPSRERPANSPVPPRPMTNPDAPMNAVNERQNLIARSTLEAAAIVLSVTLGRPAEDMLTALAAEVRAEPNKSLDPLIAIGRAKERLAAAVRAGVA